MSMAGTLTGGATMPKRDPRAIIAADSSFGMPISSRMGNTRTPVLRTEAGAEPVSMAGSMTRIMMRISRMEGDL